MDVGLFPAWTAVVGFFIGSAIGSFLNVVIYRLPRCMSIAQPTYSFCPRCKHRLGPPDLVPIFSWALQGGKCRYCRAPISPRYMVVELITGTLWAALWYQQLVVRADPATFIAYALFASALVAAIFTDLAHYIIPDEINAAMFIIGMGYTGALIAMGRPEAWVWGLPSGVAGALVGVGVLWGIAFLGRILFGRDAMGHGDIKMARGIGAVLFPALSLISFGLAVVSGAVIGILVVVLRGVLARKTGAEPPPDDEEDEHPPEALGSLVKSLFGYLLLMDIVGLFVPAVYRWWFDEDPFTEEVISDEEPVVELTMIPFGPHLAVGALAAMLFGGPLQQVVDAYWRHAFGAP